MLRRASIILTVALCLAAVISTLSIVSIHNEIQAAPASFTIPEITPTPTATPTPEPAGGGGGGRSQPSISIKLTIDIFGYQSEWLRTEQGKILEDIYAISQDGSIAIEIPAGTYALDANGDPLSEISLILTDPIMKSPDSQVPYEDYLIGTYELWPEGATFSKPINITVIYDTAVLPKAPDELTFTMYSLDNEKKYWTAIPSISNIGSNSVLFSINYLTTYALTAVPTDISHNPPGSPLPDITNPDKSDLLLLILILPAASLAFFLFAFRRQRRRHNTPENPDLSATSQ